MPKQGAERDASILSWWPTDDSWAVSGFASGYWSHDAEEWFQRRVRLIKEGKATPMTQRDWKRSLRHTFSDSHKFIAGVETLSADRTWRGTFCYFNRCNIHVLDTKQQRQGMRKRAYHYTWGEREQPSCERQTSSASEQKYKKKHERREMKKWIEQSNSFTEK